MVGEALECPYHGWRFGNDGVCQGVPGCDIGDSGQKLRAQAVAVTEKHGAVFLRLGAEGDAEPDLPPIPPDDTYHHFWWKQGVWEGRVYDAIENVLDPFHTNFIHHGFIRRRDKRLPVKLVANSFARGIEMVIVQTQPDFGDDVPCAGAHTLAEPNALLSADHRAGAVGGKRVVGALRHGIFHAG